MIRRIYVCAVVGVIVASASARADLVISWATVGNTGNSAHSTGYGSVAYEYRIGTYEVTNGQYRTFLNAVAALDTNALYNPLMGQAYGGIVRTGSSGSYSYSAKNGDSNWDNRPVNYVSFYDAARFANWLHNGQPTGTQNANTTEDGAYDMSSFTNEVRKAGARFFLPSSDEWFKAAYYDPNKPGGAGYWNYATRSDSVPDRNHPTADSGNSANYGGNTIGSPYFYNSGGAYTLSYSGYGAYDMDGNIGEWTEMYFPYPASRGTRGGAWNSTGLNTYSANWSPGSVVGVTETDFLGIRIASIEVIPEPGACALFGLGLLILGIFGRRRFRRA